jgi:predicted metalloprotease with PDZ domain
MTETFTVDCGHSAQHLLQITLDLSGLKPGAHELVMPVWTPGAYRVEDYSKNVFDVRVVDGANAKSISVEKTEKNVWQFDAEGSVTVTYQVYCYQLTVSGSHCDGTHAYWNGTNVFFVVDGEKNLPIDLQVRAPEGWRVSTGLDRVGADPFHFRAPDFDILADCPVEVGTQRVYTFEAMGKHHEIALWGYGNEDPERLVTDTRKMVEAAGAIFGGLPYEHYTFIVHVADAGGGLEHLNSTVCGVSRTSFAPWSNYRRVLFLFSHEFFHLWNVKRIHPDVLGPFDYNREVYTHLLWAMEGSTDYYAYLILCRAGLVTPEEYFEQQASDIMDLELQPGRNWTSLALSSFNTSTAWPFSPSGDPPNRYISYYLKGGLVGLLMDLEIRRRTQNERSLDDVLRILMDRYGAKGVGFPETTYQEVVEEVAGGSMAEFFVRYVEGVDELPFEEMLGAAGLELTRRVKNPDRRKTGENGDDESSEAPYGWLGITYPRSFNPRMAGPEASGALLQSVYDPGPSAGVLYPGDEVMAVDTIRVTGGQDLDARIRANFAPGTAVKIQLFRRGRLEEVTVTVGATPPNEYKIARVKEPGALQRALYEDWLKASWPEA